MISGVIEVFRSVTGSTPSFLRSGGTHAEDLALQNIQSRSRMVLSYMLAQLLPWTQSRDGFLLVLGSANVDEALRGYMTKYDCSSADINPIGGISKGDLSRLLLHGAEHFGYPSLRSVVKAPPTAELRPLDGGEIEPTDEADMGMSYAELGECVFSFDGIPATSARAAQKRLGTPDRTGTGGCARWTGAAPSRCINGFFRGGRAGSRPPRSRSR